MKIIMGIFDLFSFIIIAIWEHLIVYPVKQLVRFCGWIKFTIFNPLEGTKEFAQFWKRQYQICLEESGEDNLGGLIGYYFKMSIFYLFVLIFAAILDAPSNSIRTDGIGVRSMFIIIAIDLCYVALFIYLVNSFFSLLFGF